MEALENIWSGFWHFISKNPIYLVCSLIYYLVAVLWFGWHWWTFLWVFIVYVLSLGIAFSPAGEKLLRLFNHVRRLETAREKEYLRPLFNEVYAKARQRHSRLPEIQLCIVDSMSVNAFALGRHTIAVTKGAMKTFSEAELKAVLAHEIAHILNMDTTANLYVMVGNGIFTFMILTVKLVYWLLEKLEVLQSAVKVADAIFDAVVFVFLFIMQIALSINNRKAERRADKYAVTLGYGEDMVEALYLLEKISLSGNGSVIQRLLASHPRVTARIEALEVMLGIQDGK